jgi:hypothetical protein
MTKIITRTHTRPDGTQSFAIYSLCMAYRYVLFRQWGGVEAKALTMIMLNPSTATEVQNDPTIERCERRARQWGFDALRILNIFAFRATNPADMREAADPVGPLNDHYIQAALLGRHQAAQIVCGWGTHGDHLGRGERVMTLLQASGVEPVALRWTKHGHPQHPLYVGYDKLPVSR